MSKRYLKNIALASLVTIGYSSLMANVEATEYDLRGQASGWHIETRNQGDRYYNSGLRYIPQLSLVQTIGGDRFLDLEISLNGLVSTGSSEADEDASLDLYRLKFRLATAQTETRLGLQKLNFGPAVLLRPLMWFDRLDPRDPLGLTEGVYALRFRYDALNNASLWLWGLYGNNDTKGYELFLTAEGKPEFGCRLQYPLLDGEMALTMHTRKADIPFAGLGDFRENRLALDGRWNMEIGLWLESVFQQQRFNALRHECTKMTTLGTDYTFGIGNGLYTLFEHMAIVLSDDFLWWEEDYQVSAYSLNYPIGFLDNISATGFYFWDDGKYSQYLAWQRSWDNWILNLDLFYYPDLKDQYIPYEDEFPGRGYGGQAIIIFNH